ncbi:MAG TPA: hypothetical protein VGR14_08030 [Verrucomicrobiae bacterium]|nr:hypothetical protein [Verrucomicrobiae bacterium]
MKNKALILGSLFSLAFAIVVVAHQQPANASDHLGTWQLVSTKYGDAKDYTDYPPENRRLKMITGTHFTWLDYETKTGKIRTSAGGRYTLKDGAYTETIEFAGEGLDAYLGKPQVFTIKIDGDKLSQSGKLSDGTEIREIWQRLK